MSMSGLSGLIPTRFLCLIAHLIMTIITFWSRDDNVKACLPPQYTASDYQVKDTQVIIALSIALGLFVVEFLGFLSGVSMFSHTQNAISACAHGAAVVALIFYLFDLQCVDNYWYIFGFCNVLPTTFEVMAIVAIAGMKRGA